MLKRSYRLRKTEVSRVHKKGRRFNGPNFRLIYCPNRAGHFRAAIVISKKVLPRATDRNRMKRKISESLAKQELGNYDIILTVKTAINEKNIANEISGFKIN